MRSAARLLMRLLGWLIPAAAVEISHTPGRLAAAVLTPDDPDLPEED
jgi:hypothetical protein